MNSREATEQVRLWIVNDGTYYERARWLATDKSGDSLAAYLLGILYNAKRDSAAWYVAQEMAPNDYDRIDWSEIAEDLRGE